MPKGIGYGKDAKRNPKQEMRKKNQAPRGKSQGAKNRRRQGR